MLDGPTNDVWITPWTNYLNRTGRRATTSNRRARAIGFEDGRITSATIETATVDEVVTGDYFIFALPVEDVIDLITPAMIDADPRLHHLSRSTTSRSG